MGAVTLDDTANERARGLDRRGIHERDVLPLSRDDADTSMESVLARSYRSGQVGGRDMAVIRI
jgi:hypothetical protein